MKVKIAVACKYFVKKEVELPDDVVGKLEERVKGTGRIGSDGELAEHLGEVIQEADADDWEYEVQSIDKIVEQPAAPKRESNRSITCSEDIRNRMKMLAAEKRVPMQTLIEDALTKTLEAEGF
jgi:exosome complex RNA-binding protein Csl4|nr:hypothetical protein [uncultured Prevotella sp.]